ncbi:hypothetical protein [Roseateles cavernae]|uniref:hypothetical protein n=1 Tax=Roseateles cavernae TaxID=3153578 RepID=UPI0032E3E7FB
MSDELSAEGPSFPKTTKLLASAMMLALLVWGWRAADEIAGAEMGIGGFGFLLATFGVLACCYAGMLRGRTSISMTHISQRWLWTKRVALAEVSQAKLIHVPGLNWLIAPRLMVKVRGRGLYTFHIADPAVLALAQRLGLGCVNPY